MSYSDPNHFIPISDMLDDGVRQIEIDIIWHDGKFQICHNHQSSKINGITCNANTPLMGTDASTRYPLTEIKQWVSQHPDDLVMLYFDINQPVDDHLSELNDALKTLAPFTFTPTIARKDFKTAENAFPIQTSASELIQHYHKNIIMVTDHKPYLVNSPYLFDNSSVLSSVESTLSFQPDCSTGKKYDVMNHIKGRRLDNWYRVNADRVTFSYVPNKAYSSPEKYHNAFTVSNLKHLLYCPINIFAADTWGFACNGSSCEAHPSDPRMASFLWSWQQGYPLKTEGGGIALIDHATSHFTNKPVQADQNYAVLCLRAPKSSVTVPDQPLSWYQVNATFGSTLTKSASAIVSYAESLCTLSPLVCSR